MAMGGSVTALLQHNLHSGLDPLSFHLVGIAQRNDPGRRWWRAPWANPAPGKQSADKQATEKRPGGKLQGKCGGRRRQRKVSAAGRRKFKVKSQLL